MGWSQRLERDHANFQSAIAWGVENDAHAAAELAGANWLYYFSRGHFHEAQQVYDRLLALSDSLPALQKGWLLNGRCSVALAQNDLVRLETYAQRSLACFEEAGERDGMALSHHHLAAVASSFGNSALVEQHVAAGLELAPSAWTHNVLLQHRAGAHFFRGELDEAAALAQEIATRAEQAGDRWTLLWFRTELIAKIELARGNAAAAVSLLEQGLQEAQLFHDLQVAAQCSWTLGTIALTAGKADLAVGRMQEALELLHNAGAAQGSVEMLADLVAAQLEAGQLASARQNLEKGCALALGNRRLPDITLLLEQLARLRWLESRDPLAVSCLAAAAALRDRTRHTPAVHVGEMIEALENRLRTELSPEVFAARWQAGLESEAAHLLTQALPSTCGAHSHGNQSDPA